MIRRSLLVLMLVPLIALQLVSLAYYWNEQKSLGAYVNRVASPQLTPSEQARQIVLSLKDKPDDSNDAYFFLPVFRFLRPTAEQVIEKGGDCADRSRLVIRLLRQRGIQASKWALYNAEGESKHAVVEANVESGKMVVDPLFGIWFPNPQGGYFGIHELRQDPSILLNRLKELRAEGSEPGVDRLELYPSDQYVYGQARTINWNKSQATRSAFWVLHGVLGERAYEVRRPEFAEEPPLMVFYGVGALEALVILGWYLTARRSKRRTVEQRTSQEQGSAGFPGTSRHAS